MKSIFAQMERVLHLMIQGEIDRQPFERDDWNHVETM
jgi:hypothetical protein